MGQYRVEYDDGDVRYYHLRQKRVKLLDDADIVEASKMASKGSKLASKKGAPVALAAASSISSDPNPHHVHVGERVRMVRYCAGVTWRGARGKAPVSKGGSGDEMGPSKEQMLRDHMKAFKEAPDGAERGAAAQGAALLLKSNSPFGVSANTVLPGEMVVEEIDPSPPHSAMLLGGGAGRVCFVRIPGVAYLLPIEEMVLEVVTPLPLVKRSAEVRVKRDGGKGGTGGQGEEDAADLGPSPALLEREEELVRKRLSLMRVVEHSDLVETSFKTFCGVAVSPAGGGRGGAGGGRASLLESLYLRGDGDLPYGPDGGSSSVGSASASSSSSSSGPGSGGSPPGGSSSSSSSSSVSSSSSFASSARSVSDDAMVGVIYAGRPHQVNRIQSNDPVYICVYVCVCEGWVMSVLEYHLVGG